MNESQASCAPAIVFQGGAGNEGIAKGKGFINAGRTMSENGKAGFFRQSTWMVTATFAGGFFMTLVHTVARKMGPQEYSTFVTLLRLLIIMGIPSAALQTVFAGQTAAVTDDRRARQLSATTRAILAGTFLIWLASALAVLAASGPLSRLLKVSHPAALYFTLLLCLTSLWTPIIKGLLQGQHRFGGLGWLQITDGVGRFFMTLLVVLLLGGKAAGAMLAAFTGQFATLVIGLVLTYSIWRARPTVAFDAKAWLTEAVPLTLGLGTVLLMSSMDMLFVQGLFADTRQTALYSGAMLTGYAIIQFISPVAMVMFARVAQSAARSEKSDSLKLTLTATLTFGCIAAVGCTLLPKLPLRLMYFSNREMWNAAPLVPWFAWGLLPLTVANVLVQNILARARFAAVPWLMLVPGLYGAALCFQAPALVRMPPFDAFIRIVQTLGLAAVALCLVAAWFSRPRAQATVSDRDSAAARAIFCKSSSPEE
jgi:O-antigen/teichoic acid export membrane protein